MSARPTAAQIAQVHAVLYHRATLNQLRDDVSSINVLLGIAASTPSGSGANWIIPDTGQLDPSVTDASGFALKIASTLQQMARSIGALSIPTADRTNLVKMLNSQASAWTTRAKAWVQQTQPTSAQTKATLAAIDGYQNAGTAAARNVTAYLSSAGNQ